MPTGLVSKIAKDSIKSGPVLSSVLFWGVLLSGLLLTVVVASTVEHIDEHVTEARFEAEAMERSFLIRKQFETAQSALVDLASLYAASDEVSGDDFSRFVAPILERQAALRAFSWNPVVTHDAREAHEVSMRGAGNPEYRITHRSEEGELITAPAHEQYIVVAIIEPLEGNESALGFDVSSQVTRRNAFERARDTATMSIATPIVLVQGEGRSTGALGMLPVYRDGSAPSTVEQRRKAIEGYVVAVVDIAESITAALASVDMTDFDFNVLGSAPGGGQVELFASESFDADRQAEDWLSYVSRFPLAGYEMEVRFFPSDEYLAAGRTWVPLGVLIAGFALTALAVAIVSILLNRTVRIAQEVADRTRDIQAANRELEAEVARRSDVERELESHQRELEGIVDERTAELKATSAKLRTIVESEPECVKVVSADGRLEDMNAAGLEMIEADSFDQVRGHSVYSLIAKHDRDAFIEMNERVIAGESCTLEFELDGLRGGKRLVETHAVPLPDLEGGPNRHLAITRDITARRAFEEEQARLENQLRQKQKLESIGVMAGGIAHDFNNILQVVVGNNEIALKLVGDENARRCIEASFLAATDAAKLCDQMLTYAGRSRPDIEPVYLPDLVNSIIELLNVSHSKNAELELDFEDDVGIIRGDDAQLSQVIMNLVSNASEAIGADPGRISVRVKSVDLAADASGEEWVGFAPPAGVYVGLVVADTGCGMDAETREKIFDPFFTTKFAGRGLGLSSTLGIIQGHDGFLSVTSEPDLGTRFTVLFPVAELENWIEPEETKPEPDSLDATVMVVDDEEDVRKICGVTLETMGCEVVFAVDGKDAVKRFTEVGDTVDVVLLDVAMPKMNGNEAFPELRKIRPDIPVIFCSGYADDAVLSEAESSAYTSFLHKPYRRNQLIKAIAEALPAQSSASDTDNR